MPKYKTKFNPALAKEFPFLKLQAESEHEVACTICDARFSVATSGKRDIQKHIDSAKHLKGLQKVRHTPSMTSFLTSNDDTAQLKLQAQELTFAFHTGKHQISGRVAACTSKLINGLFDSKFTGGATKISKLITKVGLSFLKNRTRISFCFVYT